MSPAGPPMMLLSLDHEWRLISACNQWQRLLGYPREEVIGRRCADFLTEGSRRFVVDAVLPEVARSGECRDVPCQLLGKDGRIVDVLMSASRESGDADPHSRILAVMIEADARAPAWQDVASDGSPPLGAGHALRTGHWTWEPTQVGPGLVGGLSSYSTAAAEIFGVEPDQLAVDDDTFCDRFVHPEDREWLRDHLMRTARSDQLDYAAEYRIIRADGEMRIIKDVAEKIFSDDGGLVRVMGSVQDITELRLVEDALRDSEERFRTLLDSAPAFLWMADATGGITYVSKPWCDYTGLSEADALGFAWTRVVHPDDLERIREIETAAFERREPFSMDYRVLGADGAYRWFVDMGAPRFAPDGTFLGTAGSLFDITDRRRLESELQVSEARLLALADNSPMAIFLKDLEGRYLTVNREYENNHRISNAEIRGKTVFDVFPDEEAQVYAAQDRAALEGRAAARKEVTFDGPGGPRHLSIVKFPVFDGAGSLIGLGGMEIDITEIKRAEAAIRESEQRFRSIADSIPALIWMSDHNGDCIFVNKTWLDYTGRTLDCELGKGFADNIHPDDLSVTVEAEEQVFARREVFSVDYRLRGADLEYRWFLDTAAPRFSSEGRYLGHIGILVDITDRRRLETELILARDQAETANYSKTQFLANMSHELRTPLNAIIGFSEIIMKEMFGEVGVPHYLGYANDINQSGRHLLDVINDILDLSKIEAGKLELREEDCDIAEILGSALRLVRDRAAASRLALVEEIAPGLPPLRADGRAVKQIVLNLLSNAVKFTPREGRVALSAGLIPGGGLLIEVTDTGIGISPEDIPRTLEVFGQIDSSFNRRFDGTGLGLPLTKALAELHGATLELESEPGVGTRVAVAFPAERIGLRIGETALPEPDMATATALG